MHTKHEGRSLERLEGIYFAPREGYKNNTPKIGSKIASEVGDQTSRILKSLSGAQPCGEKTRNPPKASNMLRSRVIRSAAAIVAESPRETIAKNILKFKEIKAATTEAALAAAASSSPKLDLNALPAEIQGLKGYLSTAPAASGAAFQKDPSAWQNMSFGGMIGVEAQRDNTWPFVAGGM